MIFFNKPYMTGKEFSYIAEAECNAMLAGNGPFTLRCQKWLEEYKKSHKALLTHSCTGALEMAAILLNLQPGDEVIMPSYTYVSTANAFVLRGGVPVFVDINPDTLNIDENQIEAAISPRTKAIVPMHYGGVACEMDTIMDIANKHDLMVIEDAAQSIMASYKDKPLGSIGHLACLSFHETKNIISGQGGALLINDASLVKRAEIIRQNGTNRAQFTQGQVDKYTWCDIGSNYLLGEMVAAFLWAQMEDAEKITQQRLRSWERYHKMLAQIEAEGYIKRPIVPENCQHNAHMYYVLIPQGVDRKSILDELLRNEIVSVFHYVPLHSSPAGKRYGKTHGELPMTNDLSSRLIRLPLWMGISEAQQEKVVKVLYQALVSQIIN
jgi:dTDP-4-amino-4,6-dideoxygalactose transaminase